MRQFATMRAAQNIEKDILIFPLVPSAQDHSFKVNALKNRTKNLFPAKRCHIIANKNFITNQIFLGDNPVLIISLPAGIKGSDMPRARCWAAKNEARRARYPLLRRGKWAARKVRKVLK